MSTHPRLPLPHLLLAVAVVAVWGSNFVVIKLALAHLPPVLFAALRFIFALVPACFFLRWPQRPWTELAAYGVFIGVGQFAVLYLAVNGHIAPGLASLVIQTQVFFTIGLAMWIAHEPVRRHHVVALFLAACGLAVIAVHTDGSTTLGGLAMVLFAAFSWSCGNLVAKRAVGVNMVAYVVWASAFAVPPLLALSLAVEGWPAIRLGLTQADGASWVAVLWQSWGNTLFGYAAWAWLLGRHPATSIVPMALLVPVFGMGTAAWVLHESLPPWKLGAAALVLTGLALNLLWPSMRQWLRASTT